MRPPDFFTPEPTVAPGVRLHVLAQGGKIRCCQQHQLSLGQRIIAGALTLLLSFVGSPAVYAISARAALGGLSGGDGGKAAAANLQNAGAASSSLTAQRAREILQKTDAQIAALKAVQASARNILAPKGTANGLKVGWLETKDGFKSDGTPLTTSWSGAKITSANGSANINIAQSKQNAYLYWKNFSVGPQTTVNFDQSAGGNNVGNWIAFNRVVGSVNPSQIYGKIKAQGQVYILNQNGILFRNGSQINTHSLVASSLPINPYFAGDPANGITGRGLLNNSDYQFLFSALPETKTPTYSETWSPGTIAASEVGAVVVEKGATIASPVSSSGVGGRVALIGSSVINNGSISTPGGQTILAAGLQVGLNAHPSSDASLRGLDVYVGKVADATGKTTDKSGNQVGTVINDGLVEIPEGDAALVGRSVTQNGVIDSATSVSYNGRIDLQAAFNAVVSSSASKYFYDPSLTGGTTGKVEIGAGSVMRILPEWGSSATVNGSVLALPSIISILGQSIHVGDGASIYAPGAGVGSGTYYDMTTPVRQSLTSDASAISSKLGAGINITAGNWYRQSSSIFYNQLILTSVGASSAGSITVDSGATISAAGSTGVEAPITENYLTVQMRGAELANSALQRASNLRGVSLTMDARLTGTYNGQYWVGTPLGDATGFLNLIGRTAGELTAAGGTIALNAGNSVSLASSSTLDVSGGWVQYAGGYGSTTKLIYQGHLVDISQATPDKIYSGIYTGGTTESSSKWGITKTYKSILDPTQKRWQEGYLSGAAGGGITILAPSMALNGSILGTVVNGPRQIRTTASLSTLASVSFLDLEIKAAGLVSSSPYAPTVTFTQGGGDASNLSKIAFNTDFISEGGIGALTVVNHDGNIILPHGEALDMGALGSVTLQAGNVTVEGSIIAPGGSIALQTFDLDYATYYSSQTIKPSTGNSSRGNLVVGSDAVLSTAGLISFDTGPSGYDGALALNGGTISLSGYRVNVKEKSLLDVSGGALFGAASTPIYGNAGSISIAGGRDTEIDFIHDGQLQLKGTLRGYAGAGASSGSLTITAPAVQIGGSAGDSRVLALAPDFFNEGGFATFSLTGNGIMGTGANASVEIPGVLIAAGTQIEPVVQNQIYTTRTGWMDYTQDQYLRPAVSISLKSTGINDPNNSGAAVILGMTDIQEGSVIRLDPQLSLASSVSTTPTVKTGTLSVAGRVTQVDGSLIAPGGSINLSGSGSYPLKTLGTATVPNLTLSIGSDALITTAGEAVYRGDPLGLGRKIGSVLDGGSVTMSGNIKLSEGSVVDVSGASGGVYVAPVREVVDGVVNARSELVQAQDIGATTQVDSSGGSITLAGGEELLVLGTLLGKAGGASATGGTLSVSSGRFYDASEVGDSRNLNLYVTQTLAGEKALITADKAAGKYHGYIAADTVLGGGFDNLVLGGNVAFSGDVSVTLPGSIKVGTGGIISADGTVNLKAPYVALGQVFAAPSATAVTQIFSEGYAAPSYGTGKLNVEARILDMGNLVLKNIGVASLAAEGGVIRGDGTFDMAGDLTLKAAQIYPVTASSFTVAVYDHGGVKGSITVEQSGGALPLPLSAVGTLSLYASTINQNGTLVAPFGVINLGWDGTGSSPIDPLSGAGQSGALATLPTTSKLILGAQSVTSVSAIDPTTGLGITIPYGVILNQSSWIDPKGVDITSSGLPQRGVNLSGTTVTTEAGSVVDLRGGGNLSAYQWISGLLGTIDPTSQSEGTWIADKDYSVGDKILYKGTLYTARQANSGETPAVGLYWSKVQESYAILPGYSSDLLPYAPFGNTDNTGGDTGYTSASLKIGDKITIAGGSGLAAGTYTLLPSRYATMPGAYLITPKGTAQEGQASSVTQPDGSVIVAGYKYNGLNTERTVAGQNQLFELDSPKILAQRSSFEYALASSFLPSGAAASPVSDAASLVIKASAAMNLAGSVFASGASGGRGANVDLSSSANFLIKGNKTASASSGSIVLDASVLSAWNAGSILIGGVRTVSSSGTSVSVTTTKVTVDDAGSTLSAGDIILAAKDGVEVKDGSSIAAVGSGGGSDLSVSGNGALLRVSTASSEGLTRSDATGASVEGYVIGNNVTLSGGSVTLDSSGQGAIASSTKLNAGSINLSAGKIALNFDGSSQSGALNLAGNALSSLSLAQNLNLSSYGSIEFHGSGVLGSASLASLGLHAGAILGDNAGNDSILANNILLDNAKGSSDATGGAPTASGGSLSINGSVLTLGSGALSIGGFQNITASATGGIQGSGKGSLITAGNLTFKTPILTGAASAVTKITAGGALNISSSGTSVLTPGLGASLSLQGTSVNLAAPVKLPSGSLSVTATSGDLIVDSLLSVAGTQKSFFDVIKYTSAGSIALTSASGDIQLLSGSTLDLSAPEVAGSAGSLSLAAASGTVNLGGSIKAKAANGTAGSFTLDVADYNGGDLDTLESKLTSEGFTQSQNIRVRSGDVVVGGVKAHSYTLSADAGSITVNGDIDASGTTGGSISIFAGQSLTIASGANLTVHAKNYDNAGKGGSIDLEAGNSAGAVIAATAPSSDYAAGVAVLDLQSGATLDLGVDATAGLGQASGKLQLRAPQTADNSDVQVNTIASTITGASVINVVGTYTQDAATTGTALIDNYEAGALNNAAAFMANESTAVARLGALLSSANASALQLNPGEVIKNSLGSLQLASDWDLSLARYGQLLTVVDSSGNPVAYTGVGSSDVTGQYQAIGRESGFLTLSAKGDIVLRGAISDGFGDSINNAANVVDLSGNIDGLYFAPLLPVVQDASGVLLSQSSWGYRIVAGADNSSANPLAVIATAGSVKLGVPGQKSNASTTPTSGGATGSYLTELIGNYQVIRTGTGDIEVAAGGNIQLLNQFATIYTAGAQIADQTIKGKFDIPQVVTFPTSDLLGDYPQPSLYLAQFASGGGNVSLNALGNIEHLQLASDGVTLIADSSRELPTNWLMRRGQVDTAGNWSVLSGYIGSEIASTAWWINYANFFEGVGALGGGNVSMTAGGDISNVDAVIPTQGRVTARDSSGNVLTPSQGTLVETGGGDLTVRAGGNLDAGVYYVERGNAKLNVAGSIVTNKTRDAAGNYIYYLLDPSNHSSYANPDQATWLPTSFFLGKGSITVTSGGDALLGPVGNVFLQPQSVLNGADYKTYFSTYDASSSFSATSLGGSITYRSELRIHGKAYSAYQAWAISEGVDSKDGAIEAGAYQPWVRTIETVPADTYLGAGAGLLPGNISLTAVEGSIHLAGDMTLSPSSKGNITLLSAGSVNGVYQQEAGKAWSTSVINLSDAAVSSLPSELAPLSQTLNGTGNLETDTTYLQSLSLILLETASTTGNDAVLQGKIARHDQGILHAGDSEPVRIYAQGGDLSGLELYSPKQTQVLVGGNISDIAFSIQNLASSDVSIVSAGGSITLYDPNTKDLALAATDLASLAANSPFRPSARSGDIQVSGPGSLEVLAGGSIDMGSADPNSDGTGSGITSIGNARNPALAFEGASITVVAGVELPTGLASGGLDTAALLKQLSASTEATRYFGELKASVGTWGNDGTSELLTGITSIEGIKDSTTLTDEQKARLAVQLFFLALRDAGRDHNKEGTAGYGNYTAGQEAITALLGSSSSGGDILINHRYIDTKSGGNISLLAPGGKISIAPTTPSSSFPLPGVITEHGGDISIYSHGSVTMPFGRIFTLRGGDIVIWSETGDIAAGSSSKTVASAPPTRVLIDPQSGDVETDLAGLATGGGIGVLATVADVPAGNVDLIAPSGVIDAGDAGIRSTGNLNLAATKILNADNIAVSGTTAGAPPAAAAPAAPNLGSAAAAASVGAANNSAAESAANKGNEQQTEEAASVFTVEVLGYGGGESDEDDSSSPEKAKPDATPGQQAAL